MGHPNLSTERRRVVIIGAGFAGLAAAKTLARAAFDVTVIDQHNYHLFQPLLYQVATAGLSPADIAAPIRSILRDQKNTTVVLAHVSSIDVGQRQIYAEGLRFAFDDLIVATGARHAYFGHPQWMAHAPGLKTIDDATYLRRRILLAFEKAEPEPDSIERRRLLNFGRMARRETDRAGGVKVAAQWPVLRYPNIFVIGDAAQAFGLDSEPMPGVTPVANSSAATWPSC